MECPLTEKTSEQASRSISTSLSSNQLFITENLDLPDDTFRMSLDNFSVVGENVTIGDRDVSIDANNTNSNVNTPIHELPTPMNTPCTETPPSENSPPIIETPKKENSNAVQVHQRPQDLFKLSLVNKNTDSDVFVKPSPMLEVMSPAKMLQFKINTSSSATPTMKRAAIDFDFFNKNNFEQYFDDVPKSKDDGNGGGEMNYACTKTAVIVKADTVRHEIGYGKIQSRDIREPTFSMQPLKVTNYSCMTTDVASGADDVWCGDCFFNKHNVKYPPATWTTAKCNKIKKVEH